MGICKAEFDCYFEEKGDLNKGVFLSTVGTIVVSLLFCAVGID